MELKLNRKIFTEKSTIGELSINGEFFCHILEDKDRGLTDTMTASEIAQIKIQDLTCIPIGTYEIIISYSNNFKKQLPLLVDVKGFSGIRIHTGNSEADSRGCLLPGVYDPKLKDFVGNSKKTFDKLFEKLVEASKTEKIFIKITK